MVIFADGVRPPKFTIPERVTVIQNREERGHGDLRTYVNERLAVAEEERSVRIQRYASIDRAISTWQKLSQEDAERAMLEETSGRQQGLPTNLPLLATHLDDTTAFFTEIFAPESRSFYSVPQGLEEDAKVRTLVDTLNQETAFTGYAAQTARALRSLMKYNLGGFQVHWDPPTENALGGNRFVACDMYNTAWDPVVMAVERISQDAEWVADYSVMTRRALVNNIIEDAWNQERVDQVLQADASQMPNVAGGTWATRFVRPPSHVNLTIDGGPTGGDITNIPWSAFGLSESRSITGAIPKGGLEKTSVHIWLDPSEFALATRETKRYELWKLVFVNGVLCKAEQAIEPELSEGPDERIPIFLGHMTDDDMGEAQRSVMELMRGFQRFASFLMNIWVLGARKAVYGITYYDPDLFDPSMVNEGQVAGYVPIKRSGRDLRASFWKEEGKTGVENTINMLTNVLQLSQSMFPAQASTAQIAGLDRAVKDQVAALMHSGKPRLKLQTRIIDSALFMPTRRQAFRNLVRGRGEGLKGLTDEQVAKVLGSGLKSLDSERIEMFLRELIGVIGSSEILSQRFDLPGLLNAFSRSLNLGFDLGNFVMEQPQQPQGQGEPGVPEGSTMPMPGG